MDQYTLIANSLIHLTSVQLEINPQDKFKMHFREWYDKPNSRWLLDIVHKLIIDEEQYTFKKSELELNGFLTDGEDQFSLFTLTELGILPLNNEEELYDLSFTSRNFCLEKLENVWLPIPYFVTSGRSFKVGPLNWSRFKLVPKSNVKGIKTYDIILAFDTKTTFETDPNNEHVVMPDNFATEINLALCDNETLIHTFCSDANASNVDKYILEIVHPGVRDVNEIRGNFPRTSYIASYMFLINYIAKTKLLPKITMYKDSGVVCRDVDMVVDIGNSRTTALLFEDGADFKQVRKLQLTDFTCPLKYNPRTNTNSICRHSDSFDMRLAFRKVDFGKYGINDSMQFVYPSLVRLGNEANTLIHRAVNNDGRLEALSTYSSPKRYLWDGKPSAEEWKFLVLENENADKVLHLRGITNQLRGNGQIATNGDGGLLYNYSRRSLMTFSLLEMLVQATTQVNSDKYRSDVGDVSMPRKIKRMVITCPTAMSKVEREALVQCAKDAVTLLENFNKSGKQEAPNPKPTIEIIPQKPSDKDVDGIWFYDEATCSQLVYIYGEIGHKYKGQSKEFFDLYGIKKNEGEPSTLTVGSIDIGAGTSDMMIAKYSYDGDNSTAITPEPLFYDSFYQAGDDMLKELVQRVMFVDENSAFRKKLSTLSNHEYIQKMNNFVGPDYNGQTRDQKLTRRDFNVQYCVPLIYHILELIGQRHVNCVVRYSDVFKENHPSEKLLREFHKIFGFDLTQIEWEFDNVRISAIIEKYFEPLLKKVSTIMYAHEVDLIILSGRPASLPPIREIFLKYYSVSPNRLILLNNYAVGRWFPFSQNTDYVTDSKTIVAVGAALGYYATQRGKFENFVINTDLLSKKLISTVNYVESNNNASPTEYLLTPSKHSDTLTVKQIPAAIKVRQIDMDSYPSRVLYSIDWNRARMAERIIAENPMLLLAEVNEKVRKEIVTYEARLPLTITIERSPDNKETLIIADAIDRNETTFTKTNIELQIQSLGVVGKYWLDSGELNLQNNHTL